LQVENNNINGILEHPFNKEKASLLNKYQIDTLFTDSKNDLPLASISKKTFWVKNGSVTHIT
jgi:phosphoserine phosphatase